MMTTYFSKLDVSTICEILVRLTYVDLQKLVDSYTYLREITDTGYFKSRWKQYHVSTVTQILHNHMVKPNPPRSYIVDKEVDTSGERHGKSITYTLDRQHIVLEENYVQDKLEGYITHYQLAPYFKYKHIKCSQNGQTGINIFYDVDGNIKRTVHNQCTDDSDPITGISKTYYPDGTIEWDEFHKGIVLKQKWWYSNGCRRWFRDYTTSRHIDYEWFSSGQKKTETPYLYQQPHGIKSIWNEAGILIRRTEYVNGVIKHEHIL